MASYFVTTDMTTSVYDLGMGDTLTLRGDDALVNATIINSGGTMIVSGGQAWTTRVPGGVVSGVSGTLSGVVLNSKGVFYRPAAIEHSGSTPICLERR